MRFFKRKKHVHDIKRICHCNQLMCSCGKHMSEIIRETGKLGSDGQYSSFKVKEGILSVSGIKKYCEKEGYRFEG